MKLRNRKFLITTLFLLVSFVSIAQGGGPPAPPPPPPPPGLPIDNGLLLLFLGAIVYGVFKNIGVSRK